MAHLLDQGVEEGLAQVVRLETEVEQMLVLGVVVMALHLHPGVLDVGHRGREPCLTSHIGDQLGQVVDAELLGELVEDAALALLGRVLKGQGDAGHGVADVEVPPRLATFAVHREWLPYRRLDAEAIERGPPDGVEVEASLQIRMEQGVLGLHPVHDSLVEIGGSGPPDPTGEEDVGAVVNLGEVVEAPRHLGKGQPVSATVVLDVEVALLDVDVGGAVLPHRAELDQVAIRGLVANRKEQI